MTMEPILHVTWLDFQRGLNYLVDQKIDCDHIVAIQRGGLVLGVCLSHALSKPLSTIVVSRYDNTSTTQIEVECKLSKSTLAGKKVLLVDDISDFGVTLSKAIFLIQKYQPSDIITLTYAIKPQTLAAPHFHYICVANDMWVYFPWEYTNQSTEKNYELKKEEI